MAEAMPHFQTQNRLWLIVLIPLILLILPFFLIFMFFQFIISRVWALCLSLAVRLFWIPQNKSVLFVTSNALRWQEYLEQNIFPKIQTRAVILNRSERNGWKKTRDSALALPIFNHWLRYECPSAIVFKPWWKPRVFSFRKAFADYKHGKPLALKKLEADFFQSLIIR